MTMFLKESEIKGIVTYTGFHIQLTVSEDAKIVDIKDEDGSILEVKKNGSRLFFKGDYIYVKDRGWYQLNDIALMHSIFQNQWMSAAGYRIAGGTDEILRNIVANI